MTQVMPGSLLEMSRAVMRSSFSSVVPKAVYTFAFSRRSSITPELLTSLVAARDTYAVVCASPQSVKVSKKIPKEKRTKKMFKKNLCTME